MIKNIIFDIGNVIVGWNPYKVIAELFPNQNPQKFYQKMYPVWIELNLGKISEKEAHPLYQKTLDLSEQDVTKLFYELKKHQIIIPGTIDLLEELKLRGFNLYSITDNIKEILEYHRTHSTFLNYFKDIISSSDIGILKPDPRIFKYLLKKHHLIAEECVFFDDLEKNILGAKSLGIHGIIFKDAKSCKEELEKLLCSEKA